MKSAATRSALPTSLLGNTYRADTSHEIRCTHIGHDALSERRKLIKRVRSLEIEPPRERDQTRKSTASTVTAPGVWLAK